MGPRTTGKWKNAKNVGDYWSGGGNSNKWGQPEEEKRQGRTTSSARSGDCTHRNTDKVRETRPFLLPGLKAEGREVSPESMPGGVRKTKRGESVFGRKKTMGGKRSGKRLLVGNGASTEKLREGKGKYLNLTK